MTGASGPSRPVQAALASLPLLLTPAVMFALASSVLGFGGGERDVLLAVPWFLGSLVFAISSYVLIYRRWSVKRWVLRSVLVATGTLLGLWVVLFLVSLPTTGQS